MNAQSNTRIIGIAGKAGSGKDTVCNYIEQASGVRHVDTEWDMDGPSWIFESEAERLLFAEPIKEACLLIFESYGVERDDVYGPSENRNKQIGNLVRNDGQPLTIRHVLQTLGTEWGRECCYQGIWVDIALQRARTCGKEMAVITDCRFDNEFRAIRQAGGELWHVHGHGKGLEGEAGTHPSEVDLDGPVLLELRTHELENTGTLEDLATMVSDCLAHPLQ